MDSGRVLGEECPDGEKNNMRTARYAHARKTWLCEFTGELCENEGLCGQCETAYEQERINAIVETIRLENREELTKEIYRELEELDETFSRVAKKENLKRLDEEENKQP